uniref:Uncharacterized protein n=1 Tax=Setaria italica TaxID=4555 RepID=K4A407_SETIT
MQCTSRVKALPIRRPDGALEALRCVLTGFMLLQMSKSVSCRGKPLIQEFPTLNSKLHFLR